MLASIGCYLLAQALMQTVVVLLLRSVADLNLVDILSVFDTDTILWGDILAVYLALVATFLGALGVCTLLFWITCRNLRRHLYL